MNEILYGLDLPARNIQELTVACQYLIKTLNSNPVTLNENIFINKHISSYIENSIPPICFKNLVDLEWFNVTGPLIIEENLRNHIVILDFFTYCCINCLHILPDLHKLEEKYKPNKSPVIVIGIHSAKFDNEKLSKNIHDAIRKYRITHPVANDSKCELWNELEISCWPTLLILGPGGIPLFSLLGEGHTEELFKFVDATVEFFKDKGCENFECLPLCPNVHIPSKISDVFYPGKITSYRNLLAVSDSGNNRILISDFHGEIKHIIGSGKCELQDGEFSQASFSNPQGLSFENLDVLYVADTDNHAIRKINLREKTVKTIAGNGKKGVYKIGGNEWSKQEICSPWDVCLGHSLDVDIEDSSNVLFVAMAGLHQIWAVFLTDGAWLKNAFSSAGTVICVAGNGLEENRNTSYPLKAGFAQPSGLAIAKVLKPQKNSTNLLNLKKFVPQFPQTFSGFEENSADNLKKSLTLGAEKIFIQNLPKSDENSAAEIVKNSNENTQSYSDVTPENSLGSLKKLRNTIDANEKPSENPVDFHKNSENSVDFDKNSETSMNFVDSDKKLTKNTMGEIIYIADAESSSIRSLNLWDGAVKRVAGGGLDPTDLFSFGDIDVDAKCSRFQHAMGVACYEHKIYVADTYNNKIKVIEKNGKNCVVKTLLDGSKKSPNNVELSEPGGLCVNEDGKFLFIADTNNFAVKKYDFKTESLSTVILKYSETNVNDSSNLIRLDGREDTEISVNTFSESSKNLDLVENNNPDKSILGSNKTAINPEKNVPTTGSNKIGINPENDVPNPDGRSIFTDPDECSIFKVPFHTSKLIMSLNLHLPENVHLTPHVQQKFSLAYSGNTVPAINDGILNLDKVDIPVHVNLKSKTTGEIGVSLKLFLCLDSGLCTAVKYAHLVQIVAENDCEVLGNKNEKEDFENFDSESRNENNRKNFDDANKNDCEIFDSESGNEKNLRVNVILKIKTNL